MFRNETNYVLTNGVLLDGTEKMTPQTGRDIYIEGGRIGAVADARGAPPRAMRSWTSADSMCCRG